MRFNSRIYIFGVDGGGYREFLHTTLNRQEAVDYIVKFKGAFPERFMRFVYGALDGQELTEVDYGEEG